jgi:hypothetical protein
MLAVLSQNLALALSGAPTAAQMPPAGAQTAEATAAAVAALQRPVEPLSANLFDVQVIQGSWVTGNGVRWALSHVLPLGDCPPAIVTRHMSGCMRSQPVPMAGD